MSVTKGLFIDHKRTSITFDTKPGLSDMVWVDQTNGVVYNYDDYRNTWLSTSKDTLEYARKGAASGMYIPLLGDLDDSDDVYITGIKSTIVGVFCRSRAGEKSKTFEIRINDEQVYTFSYDGSDERLFINDSLNIMVDPFDKINVYVSKDGDSVINTVCRIGIARRYEI